jgi:hypothetical protein
MRILIACFVVFIVCVMVGCNAGKSSTDSDTTAIGTDTIKSAGSSRESAASYTLVAAFEGASSGDYFHLLFKDEAGSSWDFGNGKNNLAPYTDLLLPEADEEGNIGNMEYSGFRFEISWDSLESEYYCCEGEMNKVKGRVPTIVSLKLLDEP